MTAADRKGFQYFVVLQLPTGIADSEISKLASLFSPNTLETVALQHLGISQAQIDTAKADNLLNTEGFKRELLYKFKNKGHNRKVIQWNFSVYIQISNLKPIRINKLSID